MYKLNFDESWTALPNVHIKRGWFPPTTVKQLYSKQLPIPESKFNLLQELKKSLPSNFHSFYDSLPYIQSNKSVEPCADDMKQNEEIYAKDVVKKSSAGKKRKGVQETQNVDEPKVVKKQKTAVKQKFTVKPKTVDTKSVGKKRKTSQEPQSVLETKAVFKKKGSMKPKVTIKPNMKKYY